MNNSFTIARRDFLKISAGLSLAVGMAGTSSLRGAAIPNQRWVTAIRDGHLKATGKLDCWAALKALDVTGVEVVLTEALLCPGLYGADNPYTVATDDGIKRLKDDLAAHGATITAFAMFNRLDERLEEEIAWAKKVAGAAKAFGVKAVRIDVVPHKLAVDQFLPLAIKACQQFCEVVKDTPIRFGVENHSRVTNDPAFLDKLFDGVGSAQLGLTLDALNFYWFGHPLDQVYELCEKYAARVFHTHCKSLRYPAEKRNVRRPMGWEYAKYAAPIYDGDLDYRRITASLRQAGYQGDLCLENECLAHFPKEQHTAILKKEIDLLKSLAA